MNRRCRLVVRDHQAETFAILECEGLGLEFLRMAFGECELAFKRDDFRSVDGGSHHIPECGFAGGECEADAGGSTVHVVGDIDGFGVTGEGSDAADFRLCLANSGLSARPLSASSVLRAPAPRRKPSASMPSIATWGST